MAHRGRKSQYDLIEPAVLRPALAPVPASNHREPPPHFGEAERLIWGRIFEDYNLSTGLSVDVLVTSLEAHQRAREAREAISRDGMTTTGRDGQPRQHPLLAVERDARAAWLAGIKALGLEL